jgi:hypothetical protein
MSRPANTACILCRRHALRTAVASFTLWSSLWPAPHAHARDQRHASQQCRAQASSSAGDLAVVSVGADGNCFFRALAQSSAANRGVALDSPITCAIMVDSAAASGVHLEAPSRSMHHAWLTSPHACAEGRILSKDEETAAAATVRADIVSALHDQREMIEPFLTMPWDVYCRNMASFGTWGGASPLELTGRHETCNGALC